MSTYNDVVKNKWLAPGAQSVRLFIGWGLVPLEVTLKNDDLLSRPKDALRSLFYFNNCLSLLAGKCIKHNDWVEYRTQSLAALLSSAVKFIQPITRSEAFERV